MRPLVWLPPYRSREPLRTFDVVIIMSWNRRPLYALAVQPIQELLDHFIGNNALELLFELLSRIVRTPRNPDVPAFS